MKRYLALFLTMMLTIPILSYAKYSYTETMHVPLGQNEEKLWKKGYQNATETGAASTRYIPAGEDIQHWTQLLNIQFKDRSLLKATSAVEAMTEEASLNENVSYKIHSQTPNDVLFEKIFPTGENEIARMVMTTKGLHRIGYVKKEKLTSRESHDWLAKLAHGQIGGKA